MTKKEQINFVRELSKNIANEIIEKIKKGAIPDNWDGHELRQLLYDRSIPFCKMSQGRKRDYNNTVLVNNLD